MIGPGHSPKLGPAFFWSFTLSFLLWLVILYLT